MDFTLLNARPFYSSMGNPSGVKGLINNKQQLEEQQTTIILEVIRSSVQ